MKNEASVLLFPYKMKLDSTMLDSDRNPVQLYARVISYVCQLHI